MVKATFKNHFYEWKGQVHRHMEGGPQGLRATGSCAKMVMDDWMETFRRILRENKVEVYLISKYVDDVLLICKNFKLGSYWNGDSVDWSKEVQRKHEQSEMSKNKLTLEILIQMADSIHEFLNFTGEVSQEGQPIPCLDFQIWGGKPTCGDVWFSGEGVPGKPAPQKRGVTAM